MITTTVQTHLEGPMAALKVDPSLPTPSFAELTALAAFQEQSVRYLQVREDATVVGAAICCVEEGRIHGFHCRLYRLYSGKLHDYKLVYLSHPRYFEPLLDTARQDAQQAGADLVVFDEFVSSVPLHALPGVKIERLQIFEASRDPKGWAGIYGRKNIAKQLKRYAKRGGYSVRRAEVSEPTIAALGRLHRERWGYDGIRSAFASPERVAEYMIAPANKRVLQIICEGEILATHYGMVYGKTLLWHTPVVNIKYLDASPLRLLLPETARFCEQEGLECMDLGLGHEAYKARFANAYREIGTTYVALTVKGFLHNGWCRLLNPGVLKQVLVDGRARLNATVRHIATWGRRVHEYALQPVRNEVAPVDAATFHAFDHYQEFVDFMRANTLQVEHRHYRMFKQRRTLYLVADADGIVVSGWGRAGEDHMINEINRSVTMSSAHVVSGLDVRPKRGPDAGLYALLFNGIRDTMHHDRVAVLAPARDVLLNDVLRRAGGRRVATHTHWRTRRL